MRVQQGKRSLAAKAGLVAKTLEIEKLKLQIARPQRAQFGRSSEKIAREIYQLELRLEELETETSSTPAVPDASARDDAEPTSPAVKAAQYIAPPPHRLDVVLAVRGVGKLLAQLADKNVDDFDLRLVHAAVKIVDKHLFGKRRALPQAQQLQHLVLLAGEVHAGAADLDRLGVKVDDEVAGLNH